MDENKTKQNNNNNNNDFKKKPFSRQSRVHTIKNNNIMTCTHYSCVYVYVSEYIYNNGTFYGQQTRWNDRTDRGRGTIVR